MGEKQLQAEQNKPYFYHEKHGQGKETLTSGSVRFITEFPIEQSITPLFLHERLPGIMIIENQKVREMTEDKKMHHSRAGKLDRPERKKELPPDKLVELIEPYAGMSYADIGCGTGYCFWPVVESVNGHGEFFALDAQPEMLDLFADTMPTHAQVNQNVRMVLTPEDAVELPDNSQDRVSLCIVYHELPNRSEYVAGLFRVLKPGGKIAIIDWPPLAPGQERVKGPPSHHRVSSEQAISELKGAGFEKVTPALLSDELWAVAAKKPE